ncbi:fluoride efflux transporter CrcB [Virgibacillus flavescens]|uniref:fluoride efflux transporter CrcB n=1 Tax=Virgibacillus flavescens TaxID=1611422 RepID=UPI003D334961
MNIILVAVGGFFGSMLRYHLSLKFDKHILGTWVANVSGSIFLGVMLRFYLNNQLADWTWLLLGVGFCGAFTTFSTFGNESLEMILNKRYKQAIIYILSTIIISFLIVFLLLSGI